MKLYPVIRRAPVGGGGATVIEDAVTIALLLGEAGVVPADVATFELALGVADSADAPAETVQLGFPAGNFGDDATAPVEGKSVTMRVWMAGNALDGGAPANIANADGQNNGTVATLSTDLAGSATESIFSNIGANVPAGLVLTSVIYRGWFQSVNTLGTSQGLLVMRSSTLLFADKLMFANVALATTINHLAGTFTYDLLANGVDTSAELQSCRVFHTTVDAVAGVTPHVLTVDAGCIEISGAFS